MKNIEKAYKKKKSYMITNNQSLVQQYNDSLNNDVKYSLEIDPENKYNMSDEQKEFIKLYLDNRNILQTATLLNMSQETALEIFSLYSTKEEIARLNKALYQRRFATKLLNINELSSFLTSLITDENVPSVDRVSSMDKVQIVKLLIDLNDRQQNALNNPNSIMKFDIEEKVKNLSVTEIKSLLSMSKNEENDKMKKDLISKIDDKNILSIEEKSYLMTLSIDDLNDILIKKTIN